MGGLEHRRPPAGHAAGAFRRQPCSSGPRICRRGRRSAREPGVAYDLFGNGKTALKFSANRYQQMGTTGLANTYNPIALQSQQLAWTDLNRDDVAQGERGCTYLTAGCEINFGQLPTTFGAVVPGLLDGRDAGVDSLRERADRPESETHQHVELQRRHPARAAAARVGVGKLVPRRLLQPASPSKRAADVRRLHAAEHREPARRQRHHRSTTSAAPSGHQVQYLDTNAPERRLSYNGFEFTFNARLPARRQRSSAERPPRRRWR